MPGTYLHMVYAGRGDCFILEEPQHFYLIDGGPASYGFGSNSLAPYYRYLETAIRQVSATVRPNGPVSPDGVFVSHWHEDHFGGLARLFETYLAPQYAAQPTDQYPLVFNGPLFFPPLSNWTDPDAAAITHYFAAPADLDPPTWQAFAMGGPDTIQQASRTAVQPLARTWTIDSSPDNLDSLLMLHQPTAMLLTGDSIGFRIAQFLIDQDVPVLSIFKTPHHGSLRNSQLTAADASVSKLGIADFRLYWILCASTDPAAAPDPKGWLTADMVADPALLGRAKVLLSDILTAAGVDPTVLQSQIIARLEQAELDLAAGATRYDPALNGQFDTVGLHQQLAAKIKASYRFFSFTKVRTGKRALYGPRRDGALVRVKRVAHVQRDARQWTRDFLDRRIAAEFYVSRIAMAQLRAFYAGFSAKAYVISANTQHGHPAVETVAAIAQAAAARQDTPTLFVTSPLAIDLDALTAIEPNWAQSLEIRYLAHGPSARLDPTLAGAAMDVDQATEPLDPANRVGRGDLANMLESGPLFSQPGIAARAQQRIRAANGSYLNIVNGAPELDTGATAFEVDDWWSGVRVSASDMILVDDATGQSATFSVAPTNNGFKLGYYRPTVAGGAVDRFVTTNAANGFLTADPNDPAIAEFHTEPAPAAPPVQALAIARPAVATQRPFSDFCADAHLATDGSATVTAVLAALCGPLANAELFTKFSQFGSGQAAFGWPVALSGSGVAYVAAPLLTATQATLALTVPAGAHLVYLGLDHPIDDARFEITWASDLNVTLVMDLATGPLSGKVAIHFSAVITAAAHSNRIADYLIALGIAAADAAVMPLGKVLAIMLGGRGAALDVLANTPFPLLKANLPGLALGDGSYVETVTSALGRIDVGSALLIPTPPQTPPVLSIAGVVFNLSDIAIAIGSARIADQSVVLTGTATTAAGLICSLSADLTGEGDIVLQLPDSSKPDDVARLFAGASTLTSVSVPLAGALSSVPGVGSLGLLLTQASRGSNNYTVGGVFLDARIDGLKALLPAAIAPPDDSHVQVQIRNPLSDARSATVIAQFALTAPTSKKPLEVSIAVETLGAATVTAEIASGSGGLVSFAEAVAMLGLTGDKASPAADLPVLGAVLDVLCLDSAVVVVDGGQFSEVSLSLACDKPISILPNVVSIEGAELTVDYFNDAWSAKGSATVVLGSVALEASFRLPRRNAPGVIAIANPEETTIGDFLTALGLPGLSGVPVIGGLADPAITSAEVRFGYTDQTAATMAILQASVEATVPTIPLGPLTISDLALGVAYTTTSGAGPSTPAGASLWLQGDIGADHDVTVMVDYDNTDRTLSGSVVVNADASLGRLLSAVLPSGGLLDTLNGIVGALAVSHSEIELDCSGAGGPRLTGLDVAMAPRAGITVATLSVSALRLAYAVDTKNVTTTRLEGALTLTLGDPSNNSDFKGLSYILALPSGSEILFTMGTDLVAGSSPADKARFAAAIANEVVLFSAVHAKGLSIVYQPAGDPRLTIAVANAWIDIPLGSGVYTPVFKGGLTYCQVQDPTSKDPAKQVPGARASLEKVADSNAGGDFLGIPYLKLTNLKLAMEWAFELGSTMSVQGSVKIGPLDVSTSVQYANGVAKSVILTLDAGSALSDLFNACLNLTDWGAGQIPDLPFKGSLTYTAPAAGQPKTYAAACSVAIFGCGFDVTGSFIDGAGSEIKGQLADPLGALICRLTGDDGTKGPSLALVSRADTQTRTFKLGFGIEIFDVVFKNGLLAYTPATDNTAAFYEGAIGYQGNLPVLGEVDWTLTGNWSEAGGFIVRDWPLDTDMMQKLGKAVDLADILRRLSSKPGKCPPISLLQALGAGFKIAIAPTGVSDGKVQFDATVKYLISIKNSDTNKSVKLYEDELSVKGASANLPKSFADLAGMLADLVQSLAEQMIQALLLDDPSDPGSAFGWLSRLLLGMGAALLGPAVVEAILCRNPPAVPYHPDDPSNPNPPFPPLPPLPPLPPFPIPGNSGGGSNSGGDNNGSDKGDPDRGEGGGPPPPNFGAGELSLALTYLATGLSATALPDATTALANASLKADNALRYLPDGDPKVAQAKDVQAQAGAALVSRYAPAQVTTDPAAPQNGAPGSVTLTWTRLPAVPAGVTRQLQLVIDAPTQAAFALDDTATTYAYQDASLTAGTAVALELRARVVVITEFGIVPFVAPTSASATIPKPDIASGDLDAARAFLRQGQAGTTLADVTVGYANAVLKAEAVLKEIPGSDPRVKDAQGIAYTGNLGLQSAYRIQGVTAKCDQTPFGQPNVIEVDWQKLPDLPAGVTQALQIKVSAPFQDQVAIASAQPPYLYKNPGLVTGARALFDLVIDVTVQTALGVVNVEATSPAGVDIPIHLVTPPVLPVALFWNWVLPTAPLATLESFVAGKAQGLLNFTQVPMGFAVDQVNRKIIAGADGLAESNFDGHLWDRLLPAGTGGGFPATGMKVVGDRIYYVDPGKPTQLLAYDRTSKSVVMVEELPTAILSYIAVSLPNVGLSLYYLVANKDPTTMTMLLAQGGQRASSLGYDFPADDAPTSPMQFDLDSNSFFWMSKAGVSRFSKAEGPNVRVLAPTDGSNHFGLMSAALGYIPGSIMPGGRLLWWDPLEKAILMCLLDGTEVQAVMTKTYPVSGIDYGPAG